MKLKGRDVKPAFRVDGGAGFPVLLPLRLKPVLFFCRRRVGERAEESVRGDKAPASGETTLSPPHRCTFGRLDVTNPSHPHFLRSGLGGREHGLGGGPDLETRPESAPDGVTLSTSRFPHPETWSPHR